MPLVAAAPVAALGLQSMDGSNCWHQRSARKAGVTDGIQSLSASDGIRSRAYDFDLTRFFTRTDPRFAQKRCSFAGKMEFGMMCK
jgi:hypothetical protein